MRHLPLAPVVQRSIRDVECTVTFRDGHTEQVFMDRGRATYLCQRYGLPISESGKPWHVTLTD